MVGQRKRSKKESDDILDLPKHKKDSSAMEWLMTYGWAIITVLAIIGGLVYIGVLPEPSELQKKNPNSNLAYTEDEAIRLCNSIGMRFSSLNSINTTAACFINSTYFNIPVTVQHLYQKNTTRSELVKVYVYN